jgi:hypothetical protein
MTTMRQSPEKFFKPEKTAASASRPVERVAAGDPR